jgi:hypothetical protein
VQPSRLLRAGGTLAPQVVSLHFLGKRTRLIGLVFLSAICSALCSLATADEAEAIAQIETSGGSVRKIAASVEDKEVAFHLSDKEITDDALRPLSSIQNLTWLYLQGTSITDDGLQHLSGLTKLTKLHFEKTGIGDSGLVHLAGLENLEYLNLYGTKVTDAGLEHLEGMKNLKKLYLWQTGVTEQGAETLRQSLPNAEIVMGAKLAVINEEPKEEEAKQEEEKKEEPPQETLAKGRYVRVRLAGDNRLLSLAEVEVLQTKDGAALHSVGEARQSSVDYGGEPTRGNDDNTNQNYNDGSVTHTKTENDPWWQLDLNGVKDIGRIKVWNRGDCCGDRLADAIIEVLDESQKVVWSDKVTAAKDGSIHAYVKK